MSALLHCPTCRTPWRGVAICPRCGTDLGVLMRVTARAWELRNAARAALRTGDQPTEAVALAHAANRLHTTPQGQCLLALALLAAGQGAEARDLMRDLLDLGER